MLILYTVDLHGVWSKYMKILNAAIDHHVDTIVNGGDMMVAPTKVGYDNDGMAKLDFYFNCINSLGINHLVMLGNDDCGMYDDHFEKICSKYHLCHNIGNRLTVVGGQEFIGMNYVNDTPSLLKDRCRKDLHNSYIETVHNKNGNIYLSDNDKLSEYSFGSWKEGVGGNGTMEEILDALPSPKNKKDAIYVTHAPPYGIGLGCVIKQMYIDDAGHVSLIKDVGSRAIANFINKNQPKLTLHGHIHESPEVSGKSKSNIGETICVQPGQSSYHDPKVKYCIIDTVTCDVDVYSK